MILLCHGSLEFLNFFRIIVMILGQVIGNDSILVNLCEMLIISRLYENSLTLKDKNDVLILPCLSTVILLSEGILELVHPPGKGVEPF